MNEITLILHGWSDCSESFTGIKDYLIKKNLGTVKTIFYGDYESREDSITFNDIADGLNDELIRQGIISEDGTKLCDLNVIVHSTGGLVIRHWIWRYYHKDQDRIHLCPVKRLVMLAPANFGSPLAHRGKSFLGSLFKGRWKMGDFLEVGRNLLHGLELASPYQWEQAHNDLLLAKPYYNADQIQATVLVGIKDYDGLRGWVNKPGTDGTVVISGTSLDAAKLVLDFSRPAKASGYKPFEWHMSSPPHEFGFGVLPELDHGGIVDAIAATGDNLASQLLLRALTTPNAIAFKTLCTDLEQVTRQTYETAKKPRYQQFFLHAIDDQGASVRDFTMEFFLLPKSQALARGGLIGKKSSEESAWNAAINRLLLGEVHTHTIDPSYRRLLVDINQVRNLMEAAKRKLRQDVVFSMRIYVPAVDKGISYDTASLQNIVLYDPVEAAKNPLSLFYPNTTTLVEVRVDRRTSYVEVSTKPKKH